MENLFKKEIVFGDEILPIGTELDETILSQIIGANILTISVALTNSINKGSIFITNNI